MRRNPPVKLLRHRLLRHDHLIRPQSQRLQPRRRVPRACHNMNLRPDRVRLLRGPKRRLLIRNRQRQNASRQHARFAKHRLLRNVPLHHRHAQRPALRARLGVHLHHHIRQTVALQILRDETPPDSESRYDDMVA